MGYRQLDTISSIVIFLKFVKLCCGSPFRHAGNFIPFCAIEFPSHFTLNFSTFYFSGAAIGPFIGYMFSARLNAMRFRRMEEIINKKLELLSFTTINAIREIHGLEPDVMSDSEKQTLISRLISIFYFVQSSLIDAFQIAVAATSDLLENLKEEPEIKESIANITAEKSEGTQKTVVVEKDKPKTKDAGTQVTTSMPIEKIVVEKIVPQPVDYANLPEFKSLMSSLKTIEEKQDNLKKLLITSQEIQEANKIEVSVNSSDDEIISMLQADQLMVRKLLLSVSDLLQDSRSSLGATLDSIVSNIDSLSMKITNNSELYVGNLEHSMIINDIVQSLAEVKSNIAAIETIYSDDVNKQFTELTNIHGDLNKQLDGIKHDLETQLGHIDNANDSLTNGFIAQDGYVEKMGAALDGITDLLHDIRNDKSVDSVLIRVDEITEALTSMKSLLTTTADSSAEKMDSFENVLSDNLDKILQRFEDNITKQSQENQDVLLQKLDTITTTQHLDSETKTTTHDIVDVEKIISKFEENIVNQYDDRHNVILQKLEKISLSPPTTITTNTQNSATETLGLPVSGTFPEEILNSCLTNAGSSVNAQLASDVASEDKVSDPLENLAEKSDVLSTQNNQKLKTATAGSNDLTRLPDNLSEQIVDSSVNSSAGESDTEISLNDVVVAKESDSLDNMPSEELVEEVFDYPGVIKESNSSVYLYSSIVAISTVIMYFFR